MRPSHFPAMWCLWATAACAPLPSSVVLSGRAVDAPEDTANAVSQATLESRDLSLDLVGSSTSADDGGFEIEVPASETFFLVAEADGYAATAVTGFAGNEDIDAPDGSVWLKATDDLEAVATTFAGCEGAGEAGAIVEGLVRLYIPGENELDELPIVTTASVTVIETNGVTHSACYLDDDGVVDVDAEHTGYTGRFAVFGLPSGAMTVLVSYVLTEAETPTTTYWTWLPENGVFPIYPALVEMY